MEVEFHLVLADRAVCLGEYSCECMTFGMPPGLMDASGQTVCGAAGLPAASNMDPVVLQMMRQQMLLTFDIEYDGFHDKVSTEFCTTHAWSTSAGK